MPILLADIVVGLMLLLVVAFVLTVAMHAVLGVPYVPTPRSAVRAMVELVPWRGDENVYDLGAGDGRLLLEAKRLHPGIRAVGCEVVPTIWFLGVLRRWVAREDITLHLRSVFREDLRNADVVFLYLMPKLLERLMPKFERELRPGTVIVSRSFCLPGQHPIEEVPIAWLGRMTSLFLYRWTRSTAATSPV